jgi:hypothetical protein
MASRQDGTGKESDGTTFELDDAVLESLPIPGTKVLSCRAYGMWVWARQARLVCQLPTGDQVSYFLKVSKDPLCMPDTSADLNRSPPAKVIA